MGATGRDHGGLVPDHGGLRAPEGVAALGGIGQSLSQRPLGYSLGTLYGLEPNAAGVPDGLLTDRTWGSKMVV